MDMTPTRRRELRQARADGHLDASVDAAYGQRLPDPSDEAVRLAYDAGWWIAREERDGVAPPPYVSPIDSEEYARGLLCEEMGEALTFVGSGIRFGGDTPGRGTGAKTPRQALARELGDVLAAVEYACRAGLVSRDEVTRGREAKIGKLLNPDSKDNLGRRLAPPPAGVDDPEDVRLVPMAHLPEYLGRADPIELIGRRIIRYMPELETERPGDVFAAWQLDDQDTWIVLAHPIAGEQVDMDASWPNPDVVFLDLEIVSMSVDHEGFRIVALGEDGERSIDWSLSPACRLGRYDDLRDGLVVLRRPPEYRDR
jgi:hypothetical protein